MEKKTVTVKVEGFTSTGKSTITLAIINALQDYGIEVELDSLDYGSDINHLNQSMLHDISLEKRLQFIQEKTKVLVKEVQL